jgi:hypothetical protein
LGQEDKKNAIFDDLFKTSTTILPDAPEFEAWGDRPLTKGILTPTQRQDILIF